MKLLKWTGISLLVLTGLGWLVFQLPAFGGRFDGKRWVRMQKSPAFIGGRFENTPPQNTDQSLIKNLKLYQQGQIREPRFEIPVLPVSLELNPQPGLRAYWFGHASVLVEIDGVRIMTDPVLSRYVSPVPFGPERFHEPPVQLENLRYVDAVVISHDHYDHLDMATIGQLAKNGTHFYVGLGIGAHLERWKVPSEQVHEMDWWDSLEIKGVTVHCTPARHYSGRKSMDNSTLWASWFVKGPSHSFYFSGDTGYSPHFAEIRKRLGETDLALLKIGAYGSTWLDIHMDPESAIRAHKDLNAKILLPVHWATFNLAYHAWDEPIVRALAAAKAEGVTLITPRIGEQFEFGEPFENTAWYQRP